MFRAMASKTTELDALSRGFRSRYLDYRELTEQVEAWARAFPELVRLESIGKSGEGRDLWLLTLGPDPDRTRPAVWIDGNMHASELCGSSAALALAEDVLRLHLAPDASLHDLPAHVQSTLRDVVFHILPRMSPDGAEAVLSTGRWVRSVPRDERTPTGAPRWVAKDVDGDGLALLMRKRDPSGEWVAAPDHPSLLLPRRLEDAGPFFKLYPEGEIDGFDGHHIPDPHFLSDNSPDLNRNFPWQWAPEPHQAGAGAFAGSEPESRAVIEAAIARPNLFAWLNFHTFGGVFIRPLGDAPDKKMCPGDRALFRQLGEWMETITGYPMVSGFEEFTYEEDKPLHGDLSDFAYHQRGCIAYVCELWDLFRQVGMARPKRFCDHYTHATRDDLLNLARWDAEHNESRIHRPWKAARHPQLGEVEVGGFDPRVGIWNPPPDRIGDVCARQASAFFRVAALTPRVSLDPRLEGLSNGHFRLQVAVENHGYLPSCVLDSARDLPHSEAPWLAIETQGAVDVVGPRRVRLDHLDGWGRGLASRDHVMHIPRSRGSSSRRVVEWTVSGSGSVSVSLYSPRLGTVQRRVPVGSEP